MRLAQVHHTCPAFNNFTTFCTLSYIVTAIGGLNKTTFSLHVDAKHLKSSVMTATLKLRYVHTKHQTFSTNSGHCNTKSGNSCHSNTLLLFPATTCSYN